MKASIAEAMRNGLVFICATCENYWWGRGIGSEQCRAWHEKRECVGPFGGGAYREYKGPLKGNMSHFCFLCGDRSALAVDVLGKGIVGVCEKHREALDKFSLPYRKPRFVTRQTLPVIEG